MSSVQSVRAAILVRGVVQGVGFRAFTQAEAARRSLSGGVRNLDDGRVEVQVEGRRDVIETLIEALRIGPRASRVDQVRVEWGDATGRYVGFHIWA